MRNWIIFLCCLLAMTRVNEVHSQSLRAPIDTSFVAFQQEIVARMSGYEEGNSAEPVIRSTPPQRAAAASFVEGLFQSIDLTPQRHDYRLPNVNGIVDLLLPPFRGTNIYAVIEATRPNAPFIVVGAHYDSEPGSPGAGDNASGVAVVLALAGKLNQLESRDYNFILVCFDQEEDDEIGSKAFVRYLSKTFPNIHSVHITDLSGWDKGSDGVVEIQSPGPFLASRYQESSDRLGVPIIITEGASSDNKSFLAAGMQTVGVFGDVTTNLHKPTDTYDKVDFSFMNRLTLLMFDVLSNMPQGGALDEQ